MEYNKYPNNTRSQAPQRNNSISEAKKLDKKTYVEEAEKVIAKLPRKQGNQNRILLNKTQIRNILSMINELYDMVKNDREPVISDDVQSHVQYIKMKIVYAAGRDKNVKDFVEKSYLVSYLNDVGDSRENLILVCHYMEALVAYHRYNTDED